MVANTVLTLPQGLEGVHPMRKGTLGQLFQDSGVGFIRTERGEHFFFNSNDLQGVKFSSLRIRQEVEFEVGKGWRGSPRAIRVRLVQTKAK